MKSNCYLLTNLISEEEKHVVTSIVDHIEQDEKKVNIQQIANENFVSTAFIMKMCKRLGFDGYSELFYHLTMQAKSMGNESGEGSLAALIDHYSEEDVARFCSLLSRFRQQKIFAVGAGFAEHAASYMVQRLAICGFVVFNSVHFYDFMLFHEENEKVVSNVEPSFMIAISQSGEADIVINDVKRAREQGFQVATFTRRAESTLAQLSDVCFIIDGTKQTLIGGIPNPFFGKVILAFEELMGAYFRRQSGMPRE